ncbi:MAG TPA: alpha/beta fold hydrolase [Nitrososphaeraceae archaeon]|nr:alpha/beta fold hydrolase [Nitrososphaeraceae archaeon]
MDSQNKRVLIIGVSSMWFLALIISASFPFAIAQPVDNRLPVILIHGYAQDRTVWNTWVRWLGEDNFSNIHPIKFQHDDECGSAQEHAAELSVIIDRILEHTGHNQVNIVGHSKGGLDARAYLATDTDKVANLIMIGTPNAGSPAAFWDITNCPAGSSRDLLPGSPATRVEDHPENTNYFTIVGNWLPDAWCPIGLVWFPDGGSCIIVGEDDGLVGVQSVRSSLEHIPLGGEFPYDHFNLLRHNDVYEMALTVLDQ